MGIRVGADAAESLQLQNKISTIETVKEVLCVTSDRFTRFQPQTLSASGWETIMVSGLDAAAEALCHGRGVSVGLVSLSTQNWEAVEQFVSRHDEINWVALAETADLKSAPVRRLIVDLFFDYHTVPIDADRLAVTLGHARGMTELRRSLELEEAGEVQTGTSHYHDMIGASDSMQAIYATINKVAPTDFPVLISGKSGTGKELVARAIHRASPRSEQPFVVVNCGAVVPTLIQSELFGHEKGSFTSAHNRRQGHFEIANRGTIFLDEISELPLDIQANLLRVLEEKLVRRVGGTINIATDVRVIAATNRDIFAAVERGEFREDLLYRLTVVHLELPPLCERRDDIGQLARYYLRKVVLESNLKTKGFSKNAMEAMLGHTWPGNVRELVNRVKSAAVLCQNRLIHAQDLGLDAFGTESQQNNTQATLREVKEQAERRALEQTLKQTSFNVSLAARKLGVSRVTLYGLIKKHGLRQ